MSNNVRIEIKKLGDVKMKKLSVCVLLIFICFAFTGCESINKMLSKDESVFELYNQGGDITLQCGEKLDYTIKLTKQTEDFLPDSIETVCEDEGVARITYRFILWDSELHYYIEGVSKGETYICFKTNDGALQTEKIKVIVAEEDKQNTTDAFTQSKSSLIDGVILQIGEVSSKFGVSMSNFDGITKDDIEIVSADTSVITVQSDFLLSDDYVYFNVTGVSQGSTKALLKEKASDTVLCELHVDVLQNTSEEVAIESAGLQKRTVETPESTTDETTAQTATSEAESTSVQESTTETTTSTTKAAINEDTIVYITPSGTKYHYKQTCAGKNAMAVDFSSIKDEKQPCKKCVHD